MTTIDVVGLDEQPLPATLVEAVARYISNYMLRNETRVWLRIHGYTPALPPVSSRLEQWCRSFVQAGGLHCLYEERLVQRPAGAFGQVGVALASGLILPAPDGVGVLTSDMDKLLQRFPLDRVAAGNMPAFRITEPDMLAMPVNAPVVEDRSAFSAPPALPITWGKAVEGVN